MANKVTLLFDVNNTRAIAGIKKMQATTNNFSKTFGVSFAQVGMVAGVATAAIGVGITKAVRKFAEFEQSMKFVGAVTRASNEDFEKLSKGAVAMAAKTKFTSIEVADSMKTLGLAGLKTNAILKAQLPILGAAAATQADVKTTSEAVIGTMKAYGMEAESAGHITDVFAKAITSSNLDMENLKESMKVAGAAGAGFSTKMEDTVAIMGALHDVNIKGTLAGSAMKMGLIKLSKGGAKVNAVLSKLGLTYDEVNPKTNSLVDILKSLAEKNADVTDSIELFGGRAGPALNLLIKNMKAGKLDLDSFRGSLEGVADGFAEMMAEEQMDTLAGQAQILGSQFEAAQISIGAIVAKAIKPLVKIMIKALDLFNRAPGFVKILTVGLIALAGALALVTAGIAAFHVVGPSFIGAFALMKTAIASAIPYLGGMIAGIKALTIAVLTNPIGLVFLAITAAVVTFGLVFKKQIGAAIGKIVEFGKLFWAAISPIVDILKGAFAKGIKIAWNMFKGLLKVALKINPVFILMRMAIKKLADTFGWAGKKVGSMKEVVIGIRNVIIDGAIKILNAIQMIVSGLTHLIEKAQNIPGIGKYFGKAVEQTGKLNEGLTSTIEKLENLKLQNDILAQQQKAKEKGKEVDEEKEEGVGDAEAKQYAKFKDMKDKEFIEEQASLALRREIVSSENEKRLQEDAIFEAKKQELKMQKEEREKEAQELKDEAAQARFEKAENALAEHEATKGDIEKGGSVARVETYQNTANAILGAAASENKELQKTHKQFQFGQAMRDSYVAFGNALAQVPYPANIAAAAGVLVTGLSNAKKILGFKKGGIVPGSGSGDKVPIMAEPGELIIKKSMVEAMSRGDVGGGLSGESGLTDNRKQTNNFYVNDQTDMDAAFTKLDRQFARQLKQ